MLILQCWLLLEGNMRTCQHDSSDALQDPPEYYLIVLNKPCRRHTRPSMSTRRVYKNVTRIILLKCFCERNSSKHAGSTNRSLVKLELNETCLNHFPLLSHVCLVANQCDLRKIPTISLECVTIHRGTIRQGSGAA